MNVMRQIALLIFGILFFQLGYAQGFEVRQVDVEIHIYSEGYFDVVEKYDVYFNQRKHGIYRDILTEYKLRKEDGKQEERKIDISDIDVPGHIFSVSPWFARRLGNSVSIKIGDPDVEVSGQQYYEIRYRVHQAFLFEDDVIQFYWNIKSDEWQAPFYGIGFKIYPPEGVEVGMDNFFVYSGPRGTNTETNEFEIGYTDGAFVGTSHQGFHSLRGESVTTLLKLPPGTIKEIKPFWPFGKKYGWTLVVGVMISGMLWFWNRFGRSKKIVSTTSYFPPKNIDPPTAGYLIDNRIDNRDLVSLIPYWGAQGYLTVKHVKRDSIFFKNDVSLTKLKSLPKTLPKYQRTIFYGLFPGNDKSGQQSILLSELPDSFHKIMDSARKELTSLSKEYYEQDIQKVKTPVIIVTLIFGFFILPIVSALLWGPLSAFMIAALSMISIFWIVVMSKRSPAGDEIYSDLLGFKRFIKVAEENKLKTLLEEDPHYFEKTMAYAVAFGLFDKWTKKFDALNVQPPDWYSSSTGIVSMNNFSNTFATTMRSAQSTMITTPSSSSSGGGGFSGGGFGGGGGGSW